MPNFEDLHRKNLALYLKQVDAIYNEAVRQASIIGRNVPNFNPDKPFYFADYPAVKKKIDKLLDTFHSRQFTAIVNGVDSEWTLANNKNNELCNSVFGKQANLPKALAEKYYKNNHLAREAFKQRTVRGLNLSQRVWKYTDQFKQELEMGIEVALSSGRPANNLATDLKKYLRQPDKLFRRVRDKYGNLQLSKRAKSYHPGRGVYRSSYKNARRLAATETNIAYRTSDYERLQDLDFVVGIEIKLSNNHTLNGIPFTDICDELVGKYPKDFKFTGWHPLCRCHSTTILKTEEEMSNDNEKILEGKEPQNRSVNKVRTAPTEFNQWVKDNKTRMENAKSLPYFLKDNRKYVNRANKETGSVKPARSKTKQNSSNAASRYIQNLASNRNVSDSDLAGFIKSVETMDPTLFNGGLREVLISRSSKAFMSVGRRYPGGVYDGKGNIVTLHNYTFPIGGGKTFNPAKELKGALLAIKNKTPFTFNQEYALEAIWHELKHTNAKGWENVYRKTNKNAAAMETINQFCARHSYDEFVKQLGGTPIHKEAILTDGIGYYDYLVNFRSILKKYNIEEKKAFDYFKDRIQTEPYHKIKEILENYLTGNGVPKAYEVVWELSMKAKDFKAKFMGD